MKYLQTGLPLKRNWPIGKALFILIRFAKWKAIRVAA